VFLPLPINRKEILGQIERTVRAYEDVYRTDEDVVMRIVMTAASDRSASTSPSASDPPS